MVPLAPGDGAHSRRNIRTAFGLGQGERADLLHSHHRRQEALEHFIRTETSNGPGGKPRVHAEEGRV